MGDKNGLQCMAYKDRLEVYSKRQEDKLEDDRAGLCYAVCVGS